MKPNNLCVLARVLHCLTRKGKLYYNVLSSFSCRSVIGRCKDIKRRYSSKVSCAPVCNTLFWGKQGGKWLASLNAAATTYSYYPSCSWEKLGNIRDQLTPTPSTSSTSQLLNYHLGKPLKIESIQCRGQNNYRQTKIVYKNAYSNFLSLENVRLLKPAFLPVMWTSSNSEMC